MDISGYSHSLYSFGRSQTIKSEATLTIPRATEKKSETTSASRDVVVRDAAPSSITGQTRLISETTDRQNETLRKTQVFEQSDGRRFTRVEDIVAGANNSRRTVIQQNVSGNTTRLDSVIERQNDGTFKRTQKFTDAGGDTQINIETGYVPNDPFILSGGNITAPPPQPFASTRGLELDITA